MNLTSELTNIVRENQTALIRYANRLLGCEDTARDAVQEAFIKFVKARGKSNSGTIEKPTAWLYRTTRNYCYDLLRSKKRKMEITLDEDFQHLSDKEASPDSKLAKTDELKMLRKLINNLEDRDREILMLKIEHEKSYREIAEIMDLSVSNVGFILHNAVKKLRRDFMEREQRAEQEVS
jgi:RNA polymerase sigma-70 factor (ECF subfamily)